MGRRSLPKIDPTVNFESYLLQLDDLEPPLDLGSLFESSTVSQDSAIEIEVGSGKGLFLSNAAQAMPERRFLGVEVSRKYARYAAYRFAKNDCRNAKMIRGDGLKLFAEFLPEETAAAVHVYFPDPWWKERHRERRVMQPKFVQDIARVLRPAGTLHFWTDVEEYFETTIELISETGGFGQAAIVDEKPPEHDMDYRTHFERRMRLNGHPVYRSRFIVDK